MFTWVYKLISRIKVWRWERQNRWRFLSDEYYSDMLRKANRGRG